MNSWHFESCLRCEADLPVEGLCDACVAGVEAAPVAEAIEVLRLIASEAVVPDLDAGRDDYQVDRRLIDAARVVLRVLDGRGEDE